MSREKQIEEMAYLIAKTDDTCRASSITLALYTAGYRKTEWISVDERLPDEPMLCLVYTDNGDIFDTFYNEGFYTKFVTHWMPRPEAPKMKGGAE